MRYRAQHPTKVEVKDDGRGFDPELVGGRVGLLGMRERLAGIGETLRIRSTPERKTLVAEIQSGTP